MTSKGWGERLRAELAAHDDAMAVLIAAAIADGRTSAELAAELGCCTRTMRRNYGAAMRTGRGRRRARTASTSPAMRVPLAIAAPQRAEG